MMRYFFPNGAHVIAWMLIISFGTTTGIPLTAFYAYVVLEMYNGSTEGLAAMLLFGVGVFATWVVGTLINLGPFLLICALIARAPRSRQFS